MSYKEKKRERRRRDLIRMKQRSLRIAHIQGWIKYWNEEEHCNAWRYRQINRAIKQAEYISVCSCTMCGNPRRHFRYVTLQEKRQAQSEQAEWE